VPFNCRRRLKIRTFAPACLPSLAPAGWYVTGMPTCVVVQIQWGDVGVVAMIWGIDRTIRHHVSTQAPATTTLLENVEKVISCKVGGSVSGSVGK
jgi:hypothetical protein